MKLFEIDENREVQLNKPWIHLIPEFKAIIDRDKGSKGDYRGDRKLRAIRELTFVYFMEDFSSPLRDWEQDEKRKEALYYAGLEEEDIDGKIIEAQDKYAELMFKASRSLRTLKSLYMGLNQMDDQWEKENLFTATDKMGKVKYSVSDFTGDIIKLDKVYDAIRNFEKRVEDDLKKAASGIRGPNSTLGENEGRKVEWKEADIRTGSEHAKNGGGQSAQVEAQSNTSYTPKAGASFQNMLLILQEQAKKETKPKKKEEVSVDLDDEEEDDL